MEEDSGRLYVWLRYPIVRMDRELSRDDVVAVFLVLGPNAQRAYLRVARGSGILMHACSRSGMQAWAQTIAHMRALFSGHGAA